jgi:hypothetical protein
MRPFLCLLALAICVLPGSEAFADHSGVFSGRRIQRAKQGVSKAVRLPLRVTNCVFGHCR